MTQIVVNIRDTKRIPFFLELLRAFDFVEGVMVSQEARGNTSTIVEEVSLSHEPIPRVALHQLSEAALMRVWDNEHDAVYDDWRELYGVSER